MRSLFFTPKPEDVPEEPVSDRQPEENRASWICRACKTSLFQ